MSLDDAYQNVNLQLRYVKCHDLRYNPAGKLLIKSGYNMPTSEQADLFVKETTVKLIPTSLPGIILIEPKVFQDDRGFFLESYQKKHFSEAGIAFDFVQDNHSKSCQGVLRGLHYQIKQPQGKLLRVVVGEIYDVALDIRRNSSTFGKWFGTYLSAENKQMLWVPPGFAHGFYVTSPEAELLYKATDYYAPQWDRTIVWNDPDAHIEWPIKGDLPILSPKDEAGNLLATAEIYEDL